MIETSNPVLRRSTRLKRSQQQPTPPPSPRSLRAIKRQKLNPPKKRSSNTNPPLIHRIGPPLSTPPLDFQNRLPPLSPDLFSNPTTPLICVEESPKKKCENIWKFACKRRVGYLYVLYPSIRPLFIQSATVDTNNIHHKQYGPLSLPKPSLTRF
jgi:hypothetical protein